MAAGAGLALPKLDEPPPLPQGYRMQLLLRMLAHCIQHASRLVLARQLSGQPGCCTVVFEPHLVCLSTWMLWLCLVSLILF